MLVVLLTLIRLLLYTFQIYHFRLHRLLGGSTGKKSSDAMTAQIRAFSPTKFGIAKGMLMIKDDLDDKTILLPSSMIKVNKSRSKDPLHDDVVLIISGLFLSDKAITMERVLKLDPTKEAPKKEEPTSSGLAGLQPPSVMFLNVLVSRGVQKELIDQCKCQCSPRWLWMTLYSLPSSFNRLEQIARR